MKALIYTHNMKKLLLMLLIIPYIVNSQAIKCNIEVTDNYESITDTSVSITIKNITHNYIYTIHDAPIIIYMQLDNEYYITFSKANYMSKSLYIDTHTTNNSMLCERILFLSINMSEGDTSDIVNAGKIWYDEITDRFVYKVPSSTMVRQH